MVRLSVVLAFLSAFCLDQARCQTSFSQPDPVLTGYITRLVSISDFDVNGYGIISSSQTEHRKGSLQLSKDGGEVYFGEQVAVYGKIDHKRHKVEARKIIFLEPEPRTLSGVAVIDRIIKPANGNDLLLRADGYVMKIGSGTTVSYASPLAALSDVKANNWITYHGTLNPDDAWLQTPSASKSIKSQIEKANYSRKQLTILLRYLPQNNVQPAST